MQTDIQQSPKYGCSPDTALSRWHSEPLALSDASGTAQSDFLVCIDAVLAPVGTEVPRTALLEALFGT